MKRRTANYKDSNPSFGTTQHNRLIKELLPTYLRIDDRDTSQLLAYIAEYAKYVHFYNEENEIDQDWQAFFTSDISVILAQIIAINLKKVNQNFKQKYQHVRLAYFQTSGANTTELPDKFVALEELFNIPYQLALQFNTWLNQIQQIHQTEKGELELIVEEKLIWIIQSRLSGAFNDLIAYAAMAQTALGKPILLDTSPFKDIWSEAETSPTSIKTIFKVSKYKKNNNEKINNAIFYIEQIFKVFYDGLCYIVRDFEQYFEKSLLYKSNHKPNIGLFITFLQLYKHAQDDLNELSNKILLFYYQKILRQEHRLGAPDMTYVCFNLAKHVEEHTIAPGTLLRARTNGQTILYKLREEIELNKSNVALVKTLFLSKNLKRSITNEFEVVTDIYAAPIANSKDGRGLPFELPDTPWPTFGEEQLDKSIYFQNMVHEEIGFAIASPIFEIREGERKIVLTVELEESSTYILERLVEDIKEKYQDETLQDAFFRIFSPFGKGNLSVYYTSEQAKNGWVEVETINISLPDKTIWPPVAIQIAFDIDIAQPPISPYNRSGKFTKYYDAIGLPIIKIILNDFTEPYAYSFIRHLKVERVAIDIEVQRIKNFRVYNELGEVNISQPFQIFGPSPALESYLLIGNKELFKKDLSSLDIQFTWQNLPANTGKNLMNILKIMD